MVVKADAVSKIREAYVKKTPKSAQAHRRALKTFPDGVTHVGRFIAPHPLYVDRAQGSRKWDLDGNEYVDYFGGHGSLILGHAHPAVVEAVCEAGAARHALRRTARTRAGVGGTHQRDGPVR